MELPARDRAYVPRGKIEGYLLSHSHPVGSAKARFFNALGYGSSTASWLEQALLDIARSQPLVTELTTPYGSKHIVDGVLRGPGGVAAGVRTVWIVDPDGAPRLVTAYPRAIERLGQP